MLTNVYYLYYKLMYVELQLVPIQLLEATSKYLFLPYHLPASPRIPYPAAVASFCSAAAAANGDDPAVAAAAVADTAIC